MAAAESLPLYPLGAALLGALAALIVWVSMAPCRPPAPDRNLRWALNFGPPGIGVSNVGRVVSGSLVALESKALLACKVGPRLLSGSSSDTRKPGAGLASCQHAPGTLLKSSSGYRKSGLEAQDQPGSCVVPRLDVYEEE